MEKIRNGVRQFQESLSVEERDFFKKIAFTQSPEALFITCSDSRVVPHLITSLKPGDLFVLKNVGNLIAPEGRGENISGSVSVGASIEFAVEYLHVPHIIVCGHSECGAMQAILSGREQFREHRHLHQWLHHVNLPEYANDRVSVDPTLSLQNELAQINVRQQVEHLKSYSIVQKKMAEGKLGIHGWYFDIAEARMFECNEEGRFFPI